MRSYGPWAVDFKIVNQWPVLTLEICLGLLSLLAVLSADTGFWLNLGLGVILLLCLAYVIAHTLGFYSLGSRAIVAIKFRDPVFEITDRAGDVSTIEVLPNTVIWGPVIFLNYLRGEEASTGNRRILNSVKTLFRGRQLVLTPFSIGQEQYRRLVVLLRYQIKPQLQQQQVPET